jgi:hypothetical protein
LQSNCESPLEGHALPFPKIGADGATSAKKSGDGLWAASPG